MRHTKRSPYEMYRDVNCTSAGNDKLSSVRITLSQFSRKMKFRDPYFINCLLRKVNEHTGLLEVTWRKREHMEKYKQSLEQAWTKVTGLKLYEHECDDCPDEYFKQREQEDTLLNLVAAMNLTMR